MSRIGKQPVIIPEGITVTIDGQAVSVVGPKGNMTYLVPEPIVVVITEGKVIVSPKKTDGQSKALFGLARAQIANMVKGVASEFEKRLELSGVGYRAQVAGDLLTLSLGFSHPVKFVADPGISFSVVESNIIIRGIDKALVGNTAAKIRAVRKPEPYKGKGIKYVGEKVRRKAGKAAKAVGGK